MNITPRIALATLNIPKLYNKCIFTFYITCS